MGTHPVQHPLITWTVGLAPPSSHTFLRGPKQSKRLYAYADGHSGADRRMADDLAPTDPKLANPIQIPSQPMLCLFELAEIEFQSQKHMLARLREQLRLQTHGSAMPKKLWGDI